MTLQGYAIFENGPGIDQAPMLSRLDGNGAVPMWFVPSHKYRKARADGVVTVGELARAAPAPRERALLHEGPGEQPLPFGLPLPCAR